MIHTITSSRDSVNAYVEGLEIVSILLSSDRAYHLPKPRSHNWLISRHQLEELLDLGILV